MSRLFQEKVNRPRIVNCAQCKHFDKGDCTLTGAMVSYRAWRACSMYKDKKISKRGDRRNNRKDKGEQ